MKKTIIFYFLFFLALTPIVIAGEDKQDKSFEPRFFHTPFEKEFSNRFKIEHIDSSKVHPKRIYSTDKVYWFFADSPDYTKDGPWITKIYIYNEKKSMLKIFLMDHNNWGAEIKWINEKLLYIRAWWGRILGTDFIFDVEKEKIIFQEMVNYITYEQFKGLYKK